jgi:hypothetical protein
MKVVVKRWHAVAQWRWDTGNPEQDDDSEGDVCGICRVPFEGCCPSCKMPGDDCPLSTFRIHFKQLHAKLIIDTRFCQFGENALMYFICIVCLNG